MPPIVAAGLLGIMVFCLTAFILLARAKKSEPSAPAVPRINRRKEPRVPITSQFDLFWQDIDASHKSARAKGIEISEHGASVRSPKPILKNSVIQIRGRQIPFEGKAVVRYCEKRGLSYIIGVELESPQSAQQSRTAGLRA